MHHALENATEARDRLDEALTLLAAHKDRRRTLEQQLQDVELDIISDETGKHSSMSQAALDRHLKVEIPKNPEYRQIKSDLGAVISDIEGLEYDIRVAEADVRIAAARMTELGGYLQYLAAIKQAEHTKNT